MSKSNAMVATVYSTDSTGQAFILWSIRKLRDWPHAVRVHAINAKGKEDSNWQYFIRLASPSEIIEKIIRRAELRQKRARPTRHLPYWAANS